MNLGNEMSDLMNEVNNQANEMSDLMNEVKNLAKRSYELIFYSNLSALSADRQATGRHETFEIQIIILMKSNELITIFIYLYD